MDFLMFCWHKCMQSYPLEHRFGSYRHMAGSNYFISVRQIIIALKCINLKSSLKFSNLHFDDREAEFPNPVANIYYAFTFTLQFECNCAPFRSCPSKHVIEKNRYGVFLDRTLVPNRQKTLMIGVSLLWLIVALQSC